MLSSKVMTLRVAHDAIIHNVEDSRLVQHLEDLFVLGARLKPEQRHGTRFNIHDEFQHRLFCSLGSEEKDHHFGADAVFNGCPYWPSLHGSSGVVWVNGHESPTLPVQVVNRLMGGPFCFQTGTENVDRRCLADQTLYGRVSIS